MSRGIAENTDHDYEEDDLPAACFRCNGEGEIVVCVDDICRGRGECIHGDGMMLCPVCEGEEL